MTDFGMWAFLILCVIVLVAIAIITHKSMDHGNPPDPNDPDLTADPKTAEALLQAYRRGYEEGRDFERSLHPRDEHGRFKSKSK